LSANPKSKIENPKFAMVGFRLANTLSEHGAVSRGVCVADAAGALRSITEQTGILASEVGRKKVHRRRTRLDELLGFTPPLFSALDAQPRFSRGARQRAKAEFYLPAAVSEQIAHGQVSCG